jgi:hypothetical protein
MIELLNASLVHLAALVGVAALLFRDQMLLRGFLIASTLLYIVYYVVVPETPLWGAIFWSAIMIGVNAAMMVRLLFDRTQFRLSDDELRLFAAFRTLSPGEFRLLTALASWKTAETKTILTRENAPTDRLYYVLDGAIGITKGGRSFPIEAGAFIGEIAFLRGHMASATVTVEPGARYVEWPRQTLEDLLARNPGLKVALDGLFNADMAAKIARA